MQNVDVDLSVRTKQYALRILRLVRALPNTIAGRAIANQLIRCGTAIGANYRAACRARSRAEFIAKLGIVIEENDEAIFWLEVIIEGDLLPRTLVEPLLQETRELLAIMIASSKTARVKRSV
ncbi:four helix bundle protein [Candidatus Uhrbacteria bacterium]|nr:four helix bundle protein [Candidatus Uhrbacteria bacterium]MBI4434375.1 four helix bundle protein [Candidatus Uhrbacteria bacterium]